MAHRWISTAEQQELWQRWKGGESLSDIARILGISAASVHSRLRTHGGIAPPEVIARENALTLSEREEISRGIALGHSLRRIGRTLGRSPSTISREIKRNGGANKYRAHLAHQASFIRARRPKLCVLATHTALRDHVAAKLACDWSPAQIAGELKVSFPDDETMRISHETIYKTLFVQARGVLKKELMRHLRTRRSMRRSIHSTTKGQERGGIKDAISIAQRPPEVADRVVPGHWEGDLIVGSNNSQVATLVERTSRFVVLVKTEGKDATSVRTALERQVRHIPDELKRSLTWDRGTELAQHKQFTIDTGVQVYFCDPQSPWQRGTNENTNGLLRQYFPKKTDIGCFSQEELDEVAWKLNTRPRKTLDFRTPASKLQDVVALTG
ncbi:MAG: IS30 family transposase [Coriobacteriia bacterium]|jgi:IS30 family transposase